LEKYSTNAEVHTLSCGVTSVHKFDFSISFQLNKDTKGTVTEYRNVCNYSEVTAVL